MIATHDSETQIPLTALEYDKLLQLAEESASQILSAIQSESTDRLTKLVKSRDELCRELGMCAAKLKNMLSQAQRSGSISGSQIAVMNDRMQAGKKRLLKKQAECESALSASLHKCKTELTNLNQRRNLRNAYQGTVAPQQARFIDNKF